MYLSITHESENTTLQEERTALMVHFHIGLLTRSRSLREVYFWIFFFSDDEQEEEEPQVDARVPFPLESFNSRVEYDDLNRTSVIWGSKALSVC